jgi:predicted ATPase
MGGELSDALRASWLPKITNGWFFRAESFLRCALSGQAAKDDPFGGPPPDFLSHSHGEGFLRFFEERCQRQGIFIFDEPESALSPSRQIEFLKLLADDGQLRALPGHYGDAFANADGLSQRHAAAAEYGSEPTTVEQTDHYKALREFFDDPRGFVEAAIGEG